MLLMEEAERIARNEHGSVKIAVISGITNRFVLQIDKDLGWKQNKPVEQRQNK